MHATRKLKSRGLLVAAILAVSTPLPSIAGAPSALGAGDPPPPPVLKAHTTLTVEESVRIVGTAAGAQSVEVSTPVSTFVIPVRSGGFSLDLPLAQNSLNRVFFTAIAADGSRSAVRATRITRDNEAPEFHVDFPPPSMNTSGLETIEVSGRISDRLCGWAGIAVYVNGVQALVHEGFGTNGTFLALDVPLNITPAALGAPSGSTLQVVAIDRLGNHEEKSISLATNPHGLPVLERPPGAVLGKILAASGGGQSALVMAELPQPIVARIVRSDGVTPLPNKLVTFRVLKSNGRLAGTPGAPGALTFQALTDASGEATAYWTLGGDAGFGNNMVKASSNEILGPAYYNASAAPAPATKLNVSEGNNQIVQLGAPAPDPLRVWVNDLCNGIGGELVTFTVVKGDGLVDGGSQATVLSQPTGYATVSFDTVSTPGNNIVEATFPGNLGLPAVLTITGVASDPLQPTEMSGIVFDNSNSPIRNATCSLTIGTTTVPDVMSDAQGRFLFPNLPTTGPAHLVVDGSTADQVGGASIPPGESYPTLMYEPTIIQNANNVLSMPVLLPTLYAANEVVYDGTAGVTLTIDGFEGISMRVAAGTAVTHPDGTPVDLSNPITLSMHQVHVDDIPMPMTDGAAPPFSGTVQPGGATFDPPMSIIYPNMSGLPAGALTNFLSFDHDVHQFQIIGAGYVSADASQITTASGAGIAKSGWWCNCPPYAITAECEFCNRFCVDNGTLSGGTVTATEETVCKGESVEFTVKGVTDSGGGAQEDCPDGSSTSIPIPPGTVDYEWKISPPAGADVTGTGTTATMVAADEGDYTCTFTAMVVRECPPTDLTLPSKTATAITVSFKEDPAQTYGFDDWDPAGPFKSVKNGGSDTLKADISPATEATGVFFTTSAAGTLTASPAQAAASPETVTLTGVSKGEADLQARADSATGEVCEKILAKSYDEKSLTVAVVLIHEQSDDVQVIPVGQGLPNTVCVSAPLFGSLSSTAGGDDVVVGSTITTGPDGVSNSTATGGDTQVIPVGQGEPGAECVNQGANGERDTPLGGDDVYSFLGFGDDILTGANGLCESTAKSTDVLSTDVLPSAAALQTYLNSTIYNQSVKTWTVTKVAAQSINWDLDLDGLIEAVPCGGGVLRSEMTVIINNVTGVGGFDKVLIMVDNPLFPGGLLYGCMPFNQKWGFLFGNNIVTGGVSAVNTAAHELGHGQGMAHVEALGHVDGANLMRSAPPHGAKLRKHQWDLINP